MKCRRLIKTILVLQIFMISIICFYYNAYGYNLTKEYTNEMYNVSLKYDPSWIKDSKYYERYEGNDGFFQVAASTGKGRSIDEVAYNVAHEKFLPFGMNPVISVVTIDGRDGRLIMPSNDQNKNFENTAQLIVRYDTPVLIGETNYSYFILYADKFSIRDLINTIVFI